MQITVYALVDPREQSKVRYVGQTAHPSHRHEQHCRIRKARSSKEQWVQSLRQDGLMPQMVILETCQEDMANEREAYWVQQYPKEQLTNDIYSAHRRVSYRDPKLTSGPLKAGRNSYDAAVITAALQSCNWKMQPAARKLGVSRPTLYELCDKLKIDRKARAPQQ